MGLILSGWGAIDETDIQTWTIHERLGKKELTAHCRDYDHWIFPAADNQNVGCYINGLHGQCGVVCLYNFKVDGGKMKDILTIGERFAKWLGYTVMQITLTDGDRIAAATNYGFIEKDNFVNRRTANRVYMLSKRVVY